MEAFFRMHYPHIGQGGFCQHTRYIAGLERLLYRLDVIELHHLGRNRRIDRRSDVPPACATDAAIQRDKTLIHRPVITPVEHKDLRPPGNMTRESDCETVRVRCGERELPEGQTEALL